MSKTITLAQMSDSFQSAAVKLSVGQKCETACRISKREKSDKNRPIQVARETFAGGAALSDMMGVTEMPQISSLDSGISLPTGAVEVRG
jgi:hypothetical protein